MKKYFIDYEMSGHKWSVTINANSWSDAENKLDAIKRNGYVVGETVVSIPVPSAIERVMNWFR